MIPTVIGPKNEDRRVTAPTIRNHVSESRTAGSNQKSIQRDRFRHSLPRESDNSESESVGGAMLSAMSDV